jgi:hypothetical protein
VSKSACGTKRVVPAQLTDIHSGQSLEHGRRAGTQRVGVGDWHGQRQMRLTGDCHELSNQTRGPACRAVITDDHGCSDVGEAARNCGSKAAAASRDDGGQGRYFDVQAPKLRIVKIIRRIRIF